MSYFTDLPRGQVRIGAAGKIMGASQANAVLEAGCDHAIRSRSSATISPSARKPTRPTNPRNYP